MKIDIIVGIPSYNEEKSISFVVKQIDKGLSKYFSDKKSLIINADNYSEDRTKEVFLSTDTKTEKLYISTPKGVKGKGNNFHNLFQFILKSEAKSIAVFDADLKSITPEWVKYFLSPIESGQYDFIFPYYQRHPYDGTITNSICYPLIFGLAAYDVRQPIGGDFSFQRRAIKYWLKKEWDENIKNYGIDIFMSSTVIFNKLRIAQIGLGQKIHNPSGPKLNSMFDQVVSTIFSSFLENKKAWDKELKEVRKVPIISQISAEKEKIPEPPGIDKLKERGGKFITSEEWADIVYKAFLSFKKKNSLGNLKEYYFDRVVSFIKETEGLSQEESENLIRKQAQIFFKKRDKIIS